MEYPHLHGQARLGICGMNAVELFAELFTELFRLQGRQFPLRRLQLLLVADAVLEVVFEGWRFVYLANRLNFANEP